MATTTNYGWTTPDDTALVKDGAAAIRTLGSSVDTTTKNLNPSTTLGDIEYRSSTANTNTRLGIGSTGNILTVAGGVPTWAAPAAGGGLTLLSTTTLSTNSVTINVASGYKNLYIIARSISTSSADGIYFRVNANTGNDYNNYYFGRSGASTFGGRDTSQSAMAICDTSTSSSSADGTDFILTIDRYTESETKVFYSTASGTTSGTAVQRWSQTKYNSSTTISSVNFHTPSVSPTFSTGTIYIYGVN